MNQGSSDHRRHLVAGCPARRPRPLLRCAVSASNPHHSLSAHPLRRSLPARCPQFARAASPPAARPRRGPLPSLLRATPCTAPAVVPPSLYRRPSHIAAPAAALRTCKRFLLPLNRGEHTFRKREIVEDDLCRAFKHAFTAPQCAALGGVFALPWHYRGNTVAIPWHPIGTLCPSLCTRNP